MNQKPVTAEDFARDHLPSAPFYRDTGGLWHGPDPRRAFVGDPHDPDALGCWAPAIKSGMSRFLAGLARDKAGIYRVKNESGAELERHVPSVVLNGVPHFMRRHAERRHRRGTVYRLR